jgi:hypothetical protein
MSTEKLLEVRLYAKGWDHARLEECCKNMRKSLLSYAWVHQRATLLLVHCPPEPSQAQDVEISIWVPPLGMALEQFPSTHRCVFTLKNGAENHSLELLLSEPRAAPVMNVKCPTLRILVPWFPRLPGPFSSDVASHTDSSNPTDSLYSFTIDPTA